MTPAPSHPESTNDTHGRTPNTIDKHPSPTPDKDRTVATRVGVIPDPVGIGLLTITTATILALGAALNYPISSLLGIVLTGVIAAAGLRVMTNSPSLKSTIGGLAVVWVAGLVFTVLVLLLFQATATGAGGIGTALILASAALITPYGIIGSTVPYFGLGAGRYVLKRYFLGTCILVVGIALVGLSNVFIVAITFIARSVAGFLTGTGTVAGDMYFAAFGNIFLLILFLLLVRKAVHVLPFEVLTSPRDVDRIARMRDITSKTTLYAVAGLIVFGLVIGLGRIPAETSGSEFASVLTTAASIIGIETITGLTLLGIVVLGLAIIVIAATNRMTRINTGNLIGIIVPPTGILIGAIITGQFFSDEVAALILDSPAGSTIADNPALLEFITGELSIVVLAASAVALLTAALILAFPSMVATATPGDSSLAGLAAAVIGMIFLAFLAGAAQLHFALILATVAVAAIVWEIGEYSIVAAGELIPEEQTGITTLTGTAGFTSLIAIHSVATISLVTIGIVLTGVIILVAYSVAVTQTVAVVSLLFTTIAFAVLLRLLSG